MQYRMCTPNLSKIDDRPSRMGRADLPASPPSKTPTHTNTPSGLPFSRFLLAGTAGSHCWGLADGAIENEAEDEDEDEAEDEDEDEEGGATGASPAYWACEWSGNQCPVSSRCRIYGGKN